MSKEKRVQMKFDVPPDVHAKLKDVSRSSGFSMSQIIIMTIRNTFTKRDVEYDMKRYLEEAAHRSRQQEAAKPTAKQRKEIERGKQQSFTKDLI